MTAPLRAAEQADARVSGPVHEEPDAARPGLAELGGLSPPARGRPWRHGRRLRGRTDLAPAAGEARKVLPFAAAIDPRSLQRYKTEALAAAHVQHERIVPVHAVGSERGVHYYAMQFIDGQSLAALIGELRRLRDETGPNQGAATPR